MHRSPNRRLQTLISSSGLGFLVSIAWAQSSASPPTHGVEDEKVTLSPFVVAVDQDVGYAASHSLAGGRINTELIKTPADVNVLTKEFLNDLGAIDYQDAIPFMTSGVHVPVPTTDHGTTVQLRGMPAGNQTRNFFLLTRPVDLYVVERMETMRGPNSLLFGAGSVGGMLNTMTKRATRDARLAKPRCGGTPRARSQGSST